MNTGLEELKAVMEVYVRRAQRCRFEAAEHLSNAEWYERDAARICERIAELEAQDD